MISDVFALQIMGYSIPEFLAFLALIVIGIIIIVIVVELIIVFLPAVLIAVVVWFLTGGSLFWAGVAFLVVALISIIKKI